MDLSKAKYVIIVILVAFNLFLLANNLSYSRNQGASHEALENAKTILKARGVTFAPGCNLPGGTRTAHRLQINSSALDRAKLARKLLGDSYTVLKEDQEFENVHKKLVFTGKTKFTLKELAPSAAVNLKSSDKVKKAAYDYLEKYGLIDGSYIVDNIGENQDGSVGVRFIEEYKGFLVYDNYCFVRVGAKGVVQVDYSKLRIIGFSSETIEDPIDAYQALLMNYKNGGARVISGIDRGYKYPETQSVENMQLTELRPVWRIRIKGRTISDYLHMDSAGSAQDE